MSSTITWGTSLLGLLFTNADLAGVGDAGGLRGSVTPGTLYISLHDSDPGPAGDQTSNESSYPGYARAAVPKTGAGWKVVERLMIPMAPIVFPDGAADARYLGIGVAETGAGKLLYSGPVTPLNRMRGYDDTLATIVFWSAPAQDPDANYYLGAGPVTDIVVHKVLGT